MSRNASRSPRWPIGLWIAQLLVPGLGLAYGLLRWTAAVGLLVLPPILRQRRRDLFQALAAGCAAIFLLCLPALAGFLILVGGGPMGDSVERHYAWGDVASTVWDLVRWPLSLGLTVLAVAVLFRHAPRRHQPGLSWLLFGAGIATALTLSQISGGDISSLQQLKRRRVAVVKGTPAVALARRCIELEPERDFYREQLERFEKGDP